jgi:transposase InsO family protein
MVTDAKRGFGAQMGILRMMTHVRTHHHTWISRSDSYRALQDVDPEGLEARKAQRLQRRVFHADGPDQVWSIDGHDKLKRWGFAIHGAIDVYSRFLVWLAVGPSNNDPRYILAYYLDTLEALNKSQVAGTGISRIR